MADAGTRAAFTPRLLGPRAALARRDPVRPRVRRHGAQRRALAGRDAGALGARLRRQRPVQCRRAVRRRRGGPGDHPHDAAPQRAARSVRPLTRPRARADAARAPSGSVLPHRRGVRRRGGGEGALVPLPAGRRAEPLSRVERGDARRLPPRGCDPRSGATRGRPHLPARVSRPARAASPHPGRARRRARLGRPGARARTNPPGRTADPADGHRRQSARRVSDPRGTPDRTIHLDDAAREVA